MMTECPLCGTEATLLPKLEDKMTFDCPIDGKFYINDHISQRIADFPVTRDDYRAFILKARKRYGQKHIANLSNLHQYQKPFDVEAANGEYFKWLKTQGL